MKFKTLLLLIVACFFNNQLFSTTLSFPTVGLTSDNVATTIPDIVLTETNASDWDNGTDLYYFIDIETFNGYTLDDASVSVDFLTTDNSGGATTPTMTSVTHGVMENGFYFRFNLSNTASGISTITISGLTISCNSSSSQSTVMERSANKTLEDDGANVFVTNGHTVNDDVVNIVYTAPITTPTVGLTADGVETTVPPIVIQEIGVNDWTDGEELYLYIELNTSGGYTVNADDVVISFSNGDLSGGVNVPTFTEAESGIIDEGFYIKYELDNTANGISSITISDLKISTSTTTESDTYFRRGNLSPANRGSFSNAPMARLTNTDHLCEVIFNNEYEVVNVNLTDDNSYATIPPIVLQEIEPTDWGGGNIYFTLGLSNASHTYDLNAANMNVVFDAGDIINPNGNTTAFTEIGKGVTVDGNGFYVNYLLSYSGNSISSMTISGLRIRTNNNAESSNTFEKIAPSSGTNASMSRMPNDTELVTVTFSPTVVTSATPVLTTVVEPVYVGCDISAGYDPNIEVDATDNLDFHWYTSYADALAGTSEITGIHNDTMPTAQELGLVTTNEGVQYYFVTNEDNSNVVSDPAIIAIPVIEPNIPILIGISDGEEICEDTTGYYLFEGYPIGGNVEIYNGTTHALLKDEPTPYVFAPDTVGPGTYYASYTTIADNNCEIELASNVNFEVGEEVELLTEFSPDDTDFTVNDYPTGYDLHAGATPSLVVRNTTYQFLPDGAYFSGKGVVNGKFYPALAGVDTSGQGYEITFHVPSHNSNICDSTAVVVFNVSSEAVIPSFVEMPNDETSFCSTQNPLTFQIRMGYSYRTDTIYSSSSNRNIYYSQSYTLDSVVMISPDSIIAVTGEYLDSLGCTHIGSSTTFTEVSDGDIYTQSEDVYDYTLYPERYNYNTNTLAFRIYYKEHRLIEYEYLSDPLLDYIRVYPANYPNNSLASFPVVQTPSPIIINLQESYCESQATDLLDEISASPVDGEFLLYDYNTSTMDTTNEREESVGYVPLDLGEGDYVIRYDRDNNGCVGTALDTFVIIPAPLAYFEVPEYGCVKDTINFINSTTPNVVYNWEFGDFFQSNDSMPTHVYNVANEYIVSLVVEDTLSGVTCDGQHSDTIKVGIRPTVDFDFMGVTHGLTTVFQNNSIENSSNDTILLYEWDLGDLTTTNIESPTNDYANTGSYPVQLNVTTNWLCQDSLIKYVTIYKDTSVLEGTAYFEDFNTSEAGWVSTSENYRGENSSWRYKAVDGATINDAGAGNAWITSNTTDGVHHHLESSWVESPSFDISSLTRPMMSFSIWTDCEEGIDGAVVQYVIDSGEVLHDDLDWKVLGSVNDGINWYTNSGIVSDPGDQNGANMGWSGQDIENSDWKTALITLDGVQSEIGNNPNQRVRFRIVFASNDANPGNVLNDGFAFDNFFIGRRNRIVLGEQFWNVNSGLTNKTNCEDVQNGLVNINQGGYNYINYHINKPYTSISSVTDDPFYKANVYDPSARSLLYGIEKPVRAVLDGVYFEDRRPHTPFANPWVESAFGERALSSAPFEFNEEHIFSNPSTDTLEVTAIIRLVGVEPSEPIAAYTAVVKKRSINPEDSEEYLNVVQKLLPTAAGEVLNIDWSINPVYPFSNKFYTHEPYDALNDTFYVISFIQGVYSHEIYQSSIIDYIDNMPNTISSTSKSGTSTIENQTYVEESIKVWPSLIQNNLNIRVNDLQLNAEVEVFDALGHVVFDSSLTNEENNIDFHSFAPGMYIVKINTNQGELIHRVCKI